MSDLARELADSELFHGVASDVLRLVLERATPTEAAAGTVLLSPERENHHVHLVLSGRLSVHFGSVDSPEIREIARGMSVGEMSMIDGTPPSAFVVAKEASRLLLIPHDLLHHLVADTSPIAANLLRLMTQWMRENTLRMVRDREQIWQLTGHANVDALTHLYNRRWLDNALERLVEQATRGAQPLCVLMLDVDHFKRYNDAHGHVAGDQALVAMGDVLKTTLRPYDFAVRFGGEEFLVILPNTDEDDARSVAERIRQNTAKKRIVASDGATLPGVTVSIGIARNRPGFTSQALISAADAQLYRAKDAGRDCVRS